MKQIHDFYILMCALLALTFAACDGDDVSLPAGKGAVRVTVRSETAVSSLTLYLFENDGRMALRRDYGNPHTPDTERLPIAAGTCTVVVVANVATNALPQQTTVADLAEWLRENVATYPSMLTAFAQDEVRAGEVTRLTLTLQGGMSGISLSTVSLSLIVPGLEMPDYTPTRATAEETWQLRCVAEVYRQGTETRVHRRETLCERQADGHYLVELSLPEGDYDLRLWADRAYDHTTGTYYNADNLSTVTVQTGSYAAGESTDRKDAGYATATLSVDGEAQDREVTLTRPFARYRLVATDVEGYCNLMEREGYPPMENLQVRVSYQGFFPTSFNVASGKPNDSQTGIGYITTPVEADGYSSDEARQVGADFVLTNGEESSVTLTVEVIETATGEVLSRTTGINVPYRRGQLSTITGPLLTAGRTTGGIQIDTEWGDEIIVEF